MIARYQVPQSSPALSEVVLYQRWGARGEMAFVTVNDLRIRIMYECGRGSRCHGFRSDPRRIPLEPHTCHQGEPLMPFFRQIQERANETLPEPRHNHVLKTNCTRPAAHDVYLRSSHTCALATAIIQHGPTTPDTAWIARMFRITQNDALIQM